MNTISYKSIVILCIFSFIFSFFALFYSFNVRKEGCQTAIINISKNEFLSKQFGKEIYIQNHGYYYDEKNNIAYYSGYIKAGESEESGNYVFDLKNRTILNSHIDYKKSQKSIQDGPTDKNYILGIEREAGVKIYSEYDDDEFNKLAKIQLDTTCQSIKLDIKKDALVISSIELKDNFILLENGLPLYSNIESAVADKALPQGALFKVTVNENISALYIKN